MNQLLNWIWDVVNWGRKCLAILNAGRTQLVLLDRLNKSGGIDVKMDGSAVDEKLFFIWDFFLTPTLGLGLYNVSFDKSATNEIGSYEVSFFWGCALTL